MTVNHEAVIRSLEKNDVSVMLEIIADCRREYGLEGRVSSLLEPGDIMMLDGYRRPRSAYFVAVVGGRVVGGGGIAPLAGYEDSTCELQRMYLQSSYRGLGIGLHLVRACFQAAAHFRFQKCYAETIREMTTALAFYERCGFRSLNAPLGRTGHGHNDRWLLIDISATIPNGVPARG